MDSRSKLILFNRNTDYELKIYAEDNLKNLDPADIIQVREFSELNLSLHSSDSDYFEMPEMDDYFIPNRILAGDNEHYKYSANDNFLLFSSRRTDEAQVVPLVPGLYTIKIFIAETIYYSYFYVVPKDLSIPDWKTMKDELESAISGLAIDFVRRKNAESVSENISADDYSISITKIKLFLQREKEIIFIIEKLRKEARYRIGKKYNWNPIGAKNLTDSMTIRKMGERPDKRGMVFSAKRYLEYNVPENRWAHMIIHSFIMFATRSIKKLEKIQKELEKNRISNKRYDNYRQKSDVYFQKNRLQNSLDSISLDISRLSKLVSYFHTVLKDDFLDDAVGVINADIPKALILNPQYNFLYKLYIFLNGKLQV